MALTKASREINKNKLKMGKIGQVMSLAGAKLRVSRLAFAFQRSGTHMAPPIKKSFRACGISVEIDGTHDGEIHCLKPGGVAADARRAINMETANLLASVSGDDDEDPFAGLEEDEDELEENETVLDDC